MDLCRYEDEKDEGYIKVGSAIKSYVEELREKLASKLQSCTFILTFETNCGSKTGQGICWYVAD